MADHGPDRLRMGAQLTASQARFVLAISGAAQIIQSHIGDDIPPLSFASLGLILWAAATEGTWLRLVGSLQPAGLGSGLLVMAAGRVPRISPLRPCGEQPPHPVQRWAAILLAASRNVSWVRTRSRAVRSSGTASLSR